MVLVPAPQVMLPLVIVQVYLAPIPAKGTEAKLLPDSEQTVDAVLIAAEGIGLINLLYVPDGSVQTPLALVTFTDRFT